MADLKLGNLSVQMKLVADVQKKGEGAKIVPHGPSGPVKARVDITTDVEAPGSPGSSHGSSPSNGAFDGATGKSTASSAANIPRQDNKAAVAVGAGKGVLGHLLAQQPAALPDPEKLSHQELKKLLEPYFGQNVVVTSFDRDDAKTLAEATKAQSIGDSHGLLVDVTAEGLVFQRDKKKTETLKTEFWQIARIRLEDGDRAVLAQDPTYPKHFSD